jgi:Phosphotransferase enzyme family
MDAQTDAALEAATALLGRQPDSITGVRGGRNSRVYRVTIGDESFALKQYFRHQGDHRDRMQTEFTALQFMQAAGIAAIARPIASSPSADCALVEWIEGTPIPPDSIDREELEQGVHFLLALRARSRAQRGEWNAPASEARFSVEQVLENVENRLAELSRSARVGRCGERFDRFFREELEPAVPAIRKWAMNASKVTGVDFSTEIPIPDRTLSPSDFGFHNALRKPSGEVVFLDFEYFGWDDPAKMICDFILHPAMQVTADDKRRFVRQLLDGMADVKLLAERVEVLYPVFGLKWVLILLNEFLPEHLLRRQFAGIGGDTHEELQLAQLAKATTLFRHVLSNHDPFPYK